MRSFGRINQVDGMGGQWVEVGTDSNNTSEQVYITALVQCLKLNRGESPFFSNYGIPAVPSVTQQIFPDFYAALTQTQFAPFFAALTIQRVVGSFPPVYTVEAVCFGGAILNRTVAT